MVISEPTQSNENVASSTIKVLRTYLFISVFFAVLFLSLIFDHLVSCLKVIQSCIPRLIVSSDQSKKNLKRLLNLEDSQENISPKPKKLPVKHQYYLTSLSTTFVFLLQYPFITFSNFYILSSTECCQPSTYSTVYSIRLSCWQS